MSNFTHEEVQGFQLIRFLLVVLIICFAENDKGGVSISKLLFIFRYLYVRVSMYFFFIQSQMPDPKTYKQHFESKHPKAPLPDELKDQP